MKRSTIIAAVLSLLAIPSCMEDIAIDEVTDTEPITSISASIKASEGEFENTKTSYSYTTGESLWETGDELYFWPAKSSTFSGTPTAVRFKVEQGGSTDATFVGDGWALMRNSSYFASYPYRSGDTYSRVSLSYTGQSQVANDDDSNLGKYDYLHASFTTPSAGGASFTFDRVGTICKFFVNLPASMSSYRYTKLSLSYTSSLFRSSVYYDPAQSTVSLTNSSTSTTMDVALNGSEGILPENNTLTIYAMMAPTAWAGKTIKVQLYTADGYVFEGNFTPGKDQEANKKLKYTINMPDAFAGEQHGDDELITFKDEAVKAVCVDRWDTNGDGELSYGEAAAVTSLEYDVFNGNTEITSFDEFQYFTSCTQINSERETASDESEFNGAFEGCSNLRSIVLPSSLVTIGYSAFAGCTSLEEIVIPESVTLIKDLAFVGDPDLDVYMKSASPVALRKYSSSNAYCYAFGYSNAKVRAIYVPTADAVDAYKANDSYSLYKFIIKCSTYFDANFVKEFTIAATKGTSSIALEKVGSPNAISLQYKKGRGTWTSYTIGNRVELNAGEFVSFRAVSSNANFSKDASNYYRFTDTGSGELMLAGNITSLLRSSMGLTTFNTTSLSYCFSRLFYGMSTLKDAKALQIPGIPLSTYCFESMFQNCSSLTSAPSLPATTLAYYCYQNMFNGCTSLINAPSVLPATTLVDACYKGMFQGCTSLVSAPSLPATTLAYSCYQNMFNGCSSLVSAPSLPATKLTGSCYYGMFQGCTSLASAPSLPATTLASSCYQNMFNGCSLLVTAPSLPATTIAGSCYYGMFQGCTSLVSAPSLPATTLDGSCYYNMFYGCTSLINAPSELPATTVAYGCYYNMFYGCTSLINAPSELPATKLTGSCYYGMFLGCTSLVSAPSLPATTLADKCYYNMFSGCRSLINAPSVLPATTLAGSCYYGMFQNCKSLVMAPALPATRISSYSNCYTRMFYGCSNLKYAKVLSLDKLTSSYGADLMLYGVSSSGYFVMNDSATYKDGVPAGWIVLKESELSANDIESLVYDNFNNW